MVTPLTVEGAIALIARRSCPQYSVSVPHAIAWLFSYETVWQTWHPSPSNSHELNVHDIIMSEAAYNNSFMTVLYSINGKGKQLVLCGVMQHFL